MKDNILMIKNKDLEYLIDQIEDDMKDSDLMENNMEREYLSTRK